jgi:hypothetical protein
MHQTAAHDPALSPQEGERNALEKDATASESDRQGPTAQKPTAATEPKANHPN